MIKSHNRFKMNCHLAGRMYHDADMVWNDLQIGTVVRLEREEDNRYDQNAVGIVFEKDGEDYLLGYLPRSENKDIAAMLDMGWGCCYECRISAINPNAHPEEQIHLTVSIRRNTVIS